MRGSTPVNPNFLERFPLLRLNKGPTPVLDLFGAASFEAVDLALDVGISEALVDEEPSVPGTSVIAVPRSVGPEK